MKPEDIVGILKSLLDHLPAQVIKETVDIIESGHPDPVAEFELRRDAFYAGLQNRLDERFK